MLFLDGELAAALPADRNIELLRIAQSGDTQETKIDVFSAKPWVCLTASALQSPPGLFSPVANGVGGLHASLLAAQPGTTPCRMSYSSTTSKVGSDLIDSTVP